jgi:hypothetical protein
MEEEYLQSSDIAERLGVTVSNVARTAKRAKVRVKIKKGRHGKLCPHYNVKDMEAAYLAGAPNQYTSAIVARLFPEVLTFDQEPHLTGDWMLTADWHIPFVHTENFEYMLKFADHFKIRKLLVIGDFLDQQAFSKFFDMAKVPWQVEKETARDVLNYLIQWFDEIVMLMGNHELRYLKALSKASIPGGDWRDVWDMILHGVNTNKIKITFYPKATINDSWLVCHPSTYRKLAESLPRELATIEHKNVITTHAHLSSQGFDPSGKLRTVSLGMMGDPKKIGYKNLRVTAHYKWRIEFGMLFRNYYYGFPYGHTDYEFWLGGMK